MAHKVHKIRHDSAKIKAGGRREETEDGHQVEPVTRLPLGLFVVIQVNRTAGTLWTREAEHELRRPGPAMGPASVLGQLSVRRY